MKAYIWTFILWLATAVCQILGDTDILVNEPSGKDLWAWHAKKLIDQGAGWNAPSTQKPQYGVCDISTTKEPINWLRTDFINVKDAKLLNIEMRYSLLNCPGQGAGSGIHCKTYLTLYVFHAEAREIPAPEPYVVTYEKVDTITPKVLSQPNQLVLDTYQGKVATKKARGVYLAMKDQGSCVSITNFIVSYNYCSEMGSVLVKFNRTVAPVNDSHVVEQEGKCTDPYSVNKVKLSGVCLSSGKWNVTDSIECLCKRGYELVNGSDAKSLECKECRKDFYKNVVSNSKCLLCPANSASNTGRTGCSCHGSFYKLAEEAPCKALPQAPLKTNITVVKATYVAIKWGRSPDDNNGSLLYSVDCFRCKSSKDKDCQEPCGPLLQYKPSKDNITDVIVTISGLASDSYFKFRVYSVSGLNQKEKDRDKWNYAQVFAKTWKEEAVSPTDKGPADGLALSKEVKMALYIVGPILLIILISIAIFVVCVRRRDKDKRGQYGTPGENGEIELPSCGQRLYVDPGNYEDPEEALKEFAKELDKKWIMLDKIIGGGEFGDVYQGTLTRPDEETILVAVKTLKAGAAAKNRKDFISEASIMGQFCDPNVIFLEGVVTKSLPLMIVIEFMSNGSLDHFLKKMDGKLTVQQLLGMARGVSSGMKFLSEMNFVHRDLAARNVLVSENMVCKVADFGLSRELEDSAYETKGGKIPVRWTALEAIEYRKFTPASDVWSYGVLLWEIMSFAERPYWDWSNYEVMDRVKAGYRLPPPLDCPKAIHQIMLHCWDADRNKRPKFTDIVKTLDVLIRSPDKLNEDLTAEPKSPKIEYTDVTTIQDWLESIKMGQYSDVFGKAGYKHLKQVAKEDELDLNEMGIKLIGHKNKIRKSLREVKKTLSKDTAF